MRSLPRSDRVRLPRGAVATRRVVAGITLSMLAACAHDRAARRSAADERAAPPPGSDTALAAPSVDPSRPPEAGLIVQLPNGGIALRRSALSRIQRAGPHWLLARVKVKAVLRQGAFQGWRVLRYGGPGRLPAGTIVSRINRKPVERPDQFIEIWNTMSTRPQLEIELVRRGKPIRLVYRLVQD